MGTGVGIREVGYFDCAGGGQVVVENNIAYVAHMRSPHGTSVIDVRDPKNPQQLATIAHAAGHPFPQGPGRQRSDGRQPRDQFRRHPPDPAGIPARARHLRHLQAGLAAA